MAHESLRESNADMEEATAKAMGAGCGQQVLMTEEEQENGNRMIDTALP